MVGVASRLLILVALASLCAACETTVTGPLGNERQVTSEPKKLDPPPRGTRPEQMTLIAAVPADGDANGFPDTIPVVVYLFPSVRVHPLSMVEPGEFDFRLTDRDGEVLGEWIFDAQDTAAAAQDLPPGRGYVFGLRLAPGVDRRPNQPGSLTAVFTSAIDQKRIVSSGSATVRIGAGVSAPSLGDAVPVGAGGR